MSHLPLRPIKTILGQNCPFHISEEATIIMRNFLECILNQVRNYSIKNFEELNSNRERQGLRTLKRLNGCTMKKACDNILKANSVNNMGLQSQEIASLGDKNMARNTLVTKSAKKDNDEHGGINGL